MKLSRVVISLSLISVCYPYSYCLTDTNYTDVMSTSNKEYYLKWIDAVRDGKCARLFADFDLATSFVKHVALHKTLLTQNGYATGFIPLLIALGEENCLDHPQIHAIITALTQNQESAVLLQNNVISLMRAIVPEIITKDSYDSGIPLATRCVQRKKKKRRFSPRRIFSSLAYSCLQLGNIGLLGGQSAAALNLFGVLFNTAAQVVTKPERDLPDGEAVFGAMTEEELVANVTLMLKALNAARDAQSEKADVAALQGMQKKSLPFDVTTFPDDDTNNHTLLCDVEQIMEITRSVIRSHIDYLLIPERNQYVVSEKISEVTA